MNLQVAELNVETNEVTIREMTPDEAAVYKADLKASEARQKNRLAIEAEQSAARESAIAKLTALGLTEEEVKALAG